MSNPKLQQRIDSMKEATAALRARTEALREQNDRLAGVLGPDWVRELAERESGVRAAPAPGTRLAANGQRYPVDPANPLRFALRPLRKVTK